MKGISNSSSEGLYFIKEDCFLDCDVERRVQPARHATMYMLLVNVRKCVLSEHWLDHDRRRGH